MQANRRIVRHSAASSTAMILAVSAASLAAEYRQFSDFPATKTIKGKISAPDAKRAPKQWFAVRKSEKDIIREDMAKGPNFASFYYLATVGYGR